ncbi:MAG TPA: hypothetical protein DCP26_09210, partial [Brevundimonas sp.]|nr:hypothetical protein [Brevundimonas sp.]
MMTVFQGLKTVAMIGALAGLAACGQADKAPAKAEGPAETPSPAAASADSGAPMIARMMGVQVAYLESKLGPARTVQDKDRTYEIGGCTIRIRAEGGEVVGYAVPMTTACTTQAQAAP